MMGYSLLLSNTAGRIEVVPFIVVCSGGEIGRHMRLRGACQRACGFESRPEHHLSHSKYNFCFFVMLFDLTSYEPGKDIGELARETGFPAEKILKLASNENPLGPSQKALQAMYQALSQTHLYPDGRGYLLREAIAKENNLGIENVVLGNGSDEIIELCGHGFLHTEDEVITAQYSFSIYGLVARLFCAKVV